MENIGYRFHQLLHSYQLEIFIDRIHDSLLGYILLLLKKFYEEFYLLEYNAV
jgi:hypothetical protein